jgi:hypothetical protein
MQREDREQRVAWVAIGVIVVSLIVSIASLILHGVCWGSGDTANRAGAQRLLVALRPLQRLSVGQIRVSRARDPAVRFLRARRSRVAGHGVNG